MMNEDAELKILNEDAERTPRESSLRILRDEFPLLSMFYPRFSQTRQFRYDGGYRQNSCHMPPNTALSL